MCWAEIGSLFGCMLMTCEYGCILLIIERKNFHLYLIVNLQVRNHMQDQDYQSLMGNQVIQTSRTYLERLSHLVFFRLPLHPYSSFTQPSSTSSSSSLLTPRNKGQSKIRGQLTRRDLPGWLPSVPMGQDSYLPSVQGLQRGNIEFNL